MDKGVWVYMDNNLKTKTALIYERYGNNVSLAQRLAKEFGRVFYYREWKSSRPRTKDLLVGDGIEGVERVRDFFTAAESTDLLIFPDIYDGDMQRHFINRGKRVWGSRSGEDLEYKRTLFLKTLESLGMNVAPYHVCVGLSQLKKLLQSTDDLWIKVNLRGDGETWHHQTWETSKRKVALMELDYANEFIRFTCCESIDSTNESAYDGFLITSPDGKPQFTDIGFLGYENKNLSHIVHAIPYDEFPDAVRSVNDEFAPVLAKAFYRSPFGTEIKNTEEGDFFIDATCRAPEPPGSIIMEQIENLGEIMYHGAEGDLVPLEIVQPFGVQVMLYSSFAEGNYLDITVPDDDKQWFKFYNYFETKDEIHVVPESTDGNDNASIQSGAVVALGDSIEEAIDLVKERCEMVKGFDLEFKTESLMEVLQRIKDGEKQGVDFQATIPEPASIL